jgi:ATP-dependent helicase YprA (DUF1998 family)/very-short-patch-repair endonuclease
MDAFALRNRLVDDYSAYIRSFITIRDPRIGQVVDDELRNGLLWPDPLLQLNPSFEPGPWIDDLVASGRLHPECRSIFRIKPEDKPDKPLRLHKHQAEAVEAAASGDSYVLTTGTGSGKSLAYIIPIVDFVLRHGSGQGIRAIVVYPMNALANSQANELEKFLCRGYPDGKQPVTFRRYTGQEKEDERQDILLNPPDILLTNYVMLELLLTRPHEKKIVQAARERLQFFVLDELHTYRGRQGADVALLARRVREVCARPHLQCVGTSATLAGSGSFSDQQRQIAKVASRLFGVPVKPERIIGETLRRVTDEVDLSVPARLAELRETVAARLEKPQLNYDSFKADPLASWIETTFGLATEPEIGNHPGPWLAGSEDRRGTGRLKRAIPLSISGPEGAVRRLADLTNLPRDRCQEAIQHTLMAGYDVPHPETGFPVFAFRLHQFISRGDTVYASLEDPDRRHVTTQAQQFVPGDRNRVLLPVAFCRECGQEYYTVYRQTDTKTGQVAYLPRPLNDQSSSDDQQAGFLYASQDTPWPEDADEQEIVERLPEDWLEDTGHGLKVKKASRPRLPKAVHIETDGQERADGALFHFVKTPFPFCLACGVAYSGRQKSDYGKLALLSSEGRSTATTILSLATLQSLRQDGALQPEACKLLSFTDNRQDASLQAGHFNDFIEVGMLRTALYRAVQAAGTGGISHEVLPLRVFEALQLPFELYAVDPTVKFQQRAETDRALREVLAYRIYQDLRRGWRVTSPNLEQCGLLRIEYASLHELCAAHEEWTSCHPALADATPASRAEVAKTLLDYLRRELAIKVDYLDPVRQESLRQLSSQRLRDPWAMDEGEQLLRGYIAFPRPRQRGDGEESREHLYVSGRGGFGLYLRRPNTLPDYHARLSVEETALLIVQLFQVLRVAGLVEPVQEAASADDLPGYMIPASALIWQAGDGTTPLRDVIRVPRASSAGSRTNPYFSAFYRQPTQRLEGLRAREHTAQVQSDQRQQREDLFRDARLPLLYCSPTMELGVDIAQLNALNMRNVPPTPANYAQRSGRAGRSGQPALVFTYCTTGSPHDQYFFKRPQQMVSGAVTPPRLDLANEDLVRAHVHAVWLAETGQSLGSSLKEILDLEGETPTLAIQPSVQASIGSANAKAQAKSRVQNILAALQPELDQAGWYSKDWLERTLEQVEESFDRACDRWRDLYRSALKQREVQNKVIGDASRSQRDKEQAKRLRAEAEAQMELLTRSDASTWQSDFYSYRYFASEGFLPGYNFPRLPLSAYIPGRRVGKNERDEYLSRPRFLAIAEFGPRSIIYHEGSRYTVNRVILPIDVQGDHGILTSSGKLCPACGYLHPIQEGAANPDRCEQCNTLLDAPLTSLMRMQNVSTRRRDRINSDEEERTRMGYELITAVRLERASSHTTTRVATVHDADGAELLKLTYGHAATIWRINKGWRRRKPDSPPGFVLDTERGYWARNEEAIEDDPEDPMSASKQRVVPYVEDRRNCLLIEPVEPLSIEEMASLQPALKNAIQVLYQLEDSELAAEPLPTPDDRRLILLYEAAEGGAGVLRQLLDDPAALAEVAGLALRLCHFDPETGDDLRRSPHAREDCEAACYDCLMSYSNQPDHRLLDRHTVRVLLLSLTGSTVKASPVGLPRAEHVARLKVLCDSDLEREWLDFVDQRNLRLPDAAQRAIPACHTVPDFYYSEQALAVYIDGFYHSFDDVMTKDRHVTHCLEDAGFTVIRFGVQDSWPDIVQRYAWLFGAQP